MPAIKQSYANSFPAVHLRIDGWHYATNFSTEMLVVICAILVAGFNIWFFKISPTPDNSLAMQLLSYHSDANKKLVAHNNAIRTVVVNSGFITQAYADNEALASIPGAGNNTTSGNEDFNNGVMSKPNPNSVQQLVSKQVTIYVTKQGDTLGSLAKTFKISTNSIRWSNNLASDTLKPGWYLLIPPTDGVVVQITDPNFTIPDFAKKYGVTPESIVISNGREIVDGKPNLEDIPDVGQYLVIPGGKVTPPPVAKAKAKTTKAGLTDVSAVGSGGHLFPPGYCTWYVAKKVGGVKWGGNAISWLKNAQAMGVPTGRKPVTGSIMVSTESRVGHVALVTAIDGNRFKVTEMNYAGFNKVSERWVNTDSGAIKGFIYGK